MARKKKNDPVITINDNTKAYKTKAESNTQPVKRDEITIKPVNTQNKNVTSDELKPIKKTSVMDGAQKHVNPEYVKRQHDIAAAKYKVNYNKAKTGENKDKINADFKQIDKLYEETRTTRSGETSTHRKTALSKDEAAQRNAIRANIAQKYGLTEKEVDKLYNNYTKQETVKRKAEIAKDHKLSGYVGAIGDNLASGLAGFADIAKDRINYAKGEDVTADDASHYFTNSKNATRQAISDDLKTDFGKGAFNAANVVGDLASMAGLSAILPGSGSTSELAKIIRRIPSLLSGGQEAERAMVENLERGADADDAFNSALSRGALQTLFSAVSYNDKPATSIPAILKNMGANMATEGTANVAQEYVSNKADDRFLGRYSAGNQEILRSLAETRGQGLSPSERAKIAVQAKKDYNKQDYIDQFKQGALFGGITSGVQNLANIPRLQNFFPGKTNVEPETKIDAEPTKPTAEPETRIRPDEELTPQQRDIINRLNEINSGEVPQMRTMLDEDLTQVQRDRINRLNEINSGEAETPKTPDDIANRYANLYSKFDDYDYMDNVGDIEGFVQTMSDDIANGRDLTEYIDALEDSLDDAPDAEIKANTQSMIDELKGIQSGRANNSEQTNIGDFFDENGKPMNAGTPEGQTGNIPNPNGLPKEKDILRTEKPLSGEEGISNLATNSAVNADIFTREMIDNDPVIREIATYQKSSNDISFEDAMKAVRERPSELLDEYITDRRLIDNEKDVDQSMLLLRSLSEQIRNATDEDVLNRLTTQRNLLFSRLRKSTTAKAQFVQAFAKWNDTPEGALLNGRRIDAETMSKWQDRNVKAAEKNKDVAEALERIRNNDTLTESLEETPSKAKKGRKPKDDSEKSSPRLDKALRQQGYDGSMDQEPKTPKTHEQHRVEVENSIRKELGSVADQFTENDFEYLTSLVENKVPVDIITDEIEHKLNHGEWYTIDESTPVKKRTSGKLATVLKNMGDDRLKASNKALDNGYPKKSHATIVEEVTNTLEKEAAGLGLDTPTDIEFLATMIEEKIPNWQIEDEINHRLMTGEWYSLDESIEEPKPTNKKLQNALNSLVEEDTPKVEKEPPTFDQIRTEVGNTLEKEFGSLKEFSDSDIDYIANLINDGATKQELAEALDMKLSTGRFDISEETQAKVNELFETANHYDPDSKEAVEAKAEAYKLIAQEVVGDASPYEVFEAWRYLAMLGNPKTMLRNYIGNQTFGIVTGASNSLAALMEEGTDRLVKKLGGKGIQRTKAILDPEKDMDLIRRSGEDGDAHRYRELQSSKYEKSTKDKIKQSKSVFKTKLAQGYENLTDKGISDYKAVKRKYSTSLAGYLKANGYDESIFDADNTYRGLKELSKKRQLTDAERIQMEDAKAAYDVLEKARDYAVKQAEYATFHEDNAVAKALTKWSRDARNSESKALNAVGYVIEGITPFKGTPANVLRSAVDYSPFGAIDSISKTGKLIYENTGKRKGNLADTYTTKGLLGKEKTVDRTLAADVIDSWSKTLTGTGLTWLGYYLFNKGILNSSNKGEKYQDQLEGIQNYSITINGKTYTIDWAVPAAMPLLIGAELAKIKEANAMSDKKWYENLDSVIATVNNLIDPLLETSFMQGVQNSLEAAANAVRYDEDNSGALGGIAGAFAMNALTGYLSQGIPTVLGQVARTVDPVRRATDIATDQAFLGGVESQARKQMNKIPFLSMLNPEYRDAYGRTQNNSPFNNVLGNFAYQALSPSYVANINQEDADIMARQIYNSKDSNGNPLLDNSVFPTWKSKVKVGDQKLTPEEMEVYRKSSGELNLELRNILANDPRFKELSPESQQKIYKGLNTLVDKAGKEAAGFEQSNDDYKKYKEYGKEGYLEYLTLGAELKENGLDNSADNRDLLKEGGVPALKQMIHDQELGAELKSLGRRNTEKNRQELEAGGQKYIAQKAIEQSFEDQYGVKASDNAIKAVNDYGVTGEMLQELKDMEVYPGHKADFIQYGKAYKAGLVPNPKGFNALYSDINKYYTKTKGVGQDDLINYANATKTPNAEILFDVFWDPTAANQPVYENGQWKKVRNK